MGKSMNRTGRQNKTRAQKVVGAIEAKQRHGATFREKGKKINNDRDFCSNLMQMGISIKELRSKIS